MPETYKTFASYLLFKEHSADSLGHLYRAGEFNSAGVHRAVWLRIFDHPAIPRDDVISAFDRAARIAASVQSSSVASGVDCVVDNGTPAMATDFVPSQPLSSLMARAAQERFPVTIDNALLIAEKVSAALCAALAAEIDGRRVVHGFLDPGLIFITNDGEAIVSGFGIGEELLALVDDAESAPEIQPYFAPEVVQSRAASASGDVYSLGSILFRLLTGTALPAPPEDRARALVGAVTQEGEALPDDIGALLERALAPRPEERFGSAADFKKELDRLLYGGAYSPTSFNLALFVDRLFRANIEAEDDAISKEMKIDVGPYLKPVVEPGAVIRKPARDRQPRRPVRSLWAGAGIVAMVAAIVLILWFTIGRVPSAPPPPPTPTAQEIAAQRRAQDEKMRALAESLVADMMAEKEEEIRQELTARQEKIEELQRRLADSQRRAAQGQIDIEEERRREELQRQIAAEEEAKRQREANLEAERVEAAEAAQRQTELLRTATPEPNDGAEAAAVAQIPPQPQPTTSPTGTATPQIMDTVSSSAIVENDFVDPSEVDTVPVIIKESPVAWPRAALHSRRRGVVILQTTVNAKGTVEDLTVLRADHEGFGIPQAVMDAVRKYRFKPATQNGVRVKTYFTVTKAYRFVTR